MRFRVQLPCHILGSDIRTVGNRYHHAFEVNDGISLLIHADSRLMNGEMRVCELVQCLRDTALTL